MSETVLTRLLDNGNSIDKRLNEVRCGSGVRCAECLSLTNRPVRVFKSEIAYIRHVRGHDIPVSQKKQLVRFGRAYFLMPKMVKMGIIA